MCAIPAFAILTLFVVPLWVFCHFVPAHALTEGFSAKMAISGRVIKLLLFDINKL